MLNQLQKGNNLKKIYRQPVYLVKEDHSKDQSKAYAELTLDSASDLLRKIRTFGNINKTHVLTDIGSGNGKLLSHWLTMTESTKAIGVERNKQRCKISKELFNEMEGMEGKKCQVINKDVMKYKNFSNVVFFNDLLFDNKATLHVWDNLKPDSLFITYKHLLETYPIGTIELSQNLKFPKITARIYRKPYFKGGLVSRLGLLLKD
tara:strand:+ start:1674 stop:2288 length:615 start_codon:yes stop_codon:yes gene_type:complete